MKKFLFGFLIALSFSAVALNVRENYINVGKTGNTIYINFGKSGTIRFNSSTNKLEFSNDQTNYKKIGAGAGGASGVNFFETNPDADSGTNGWTNIGGGAFTVTQTLPLVGDNSFLWDASAQGDILRTEAIVIPEYWKGKACQIEFKYSGLTGTSDLIKPQVVDTSFVKLPGATYYNQEDGSEFLQEQSGSVIRSIWFVCPLSGNIHFEYNQTAAGNPAADFKFDDVHIGELIGLVETTLPSVFSARISSGGIVQTTNVEFINGNCIESPAGTFACSFIPGRFTVSPVCVSESLDGAGSVDVFAHLHAVTTAGFTAYTVFAGNLDGSVTWGVVCHAQGVDAHKTVKTVISVPKVAEVVNKFVAQYNLTTNAITNENVNWLTGNIEVDTVGQDRITIVGGIFQNSAPVCTCTAQTGGITCRVDDVTSLRVRITLMDSAGVQVNGSVSLKCDKGENDFRMPIVRYIVAGQVLNSAASTGGKNLQTEGCKINNSGTPAADVDSGLCEGWIDNLADNATGDTTFNIVAGTFAKKPICSITPLGGSNSCVSFETVEISITGGRVLTSRCTTDALTDFDFYLECTGVR